MALLVLLAGCCTPDIRDDISEVLGVSVDTEVVELHEDTHGGFHGDGETYVEIQVDAEHEFIIPDSGFWHELPMSENIYRMVYQYRTPMLYNDSGVSRIPEIENGWYFFYDRHSQSISPSRDDDLFTRGSFNLTLAIYDADTGKLYYYELDT